MSIGKTIQKYRKLNGITQKKLSELTGIAVETISRWEHDKFKPNIKQVEILASTFGIEPYDLMSSESCSTSKEKPKYGDYWIAELSFFNGNPVNRYIIRIEGFIADRIIFAPFLADSFELYYSDRIPHFSLIKKIEMW